MGRGAEGKGVNEHLADEHLLRRAPFPLIKKNTRYLSCCHVAAAPGRSLPKSAQRWAPHRRLRHYLVNANVFGTDKPEILGRFGKFYSDFSSACVRPTKAGYTTSSFRQILRVMDDKSLAYFHPSCYGY